MPTRSTKGTKSVRTNAKTKRQSVKNPAALRTSKRARSIIELLLEEMRQGMRDPDRVMTKEWERLFGSKQSVVVNLQKLVQALSVLPDGEAVEEVDSPTALPPMTAEEVAILKAWLAEG